MLEKTFRKIYTRFKMHFYQTVSKKQEQSDYALTTFETFCMEGILALQEPTVAQFGRLMNLSTPNAAYKVNNLIKKGYVQKIQSEVDRREYHLKPTQKYLDYYNVSYSYLRTVVQRAEEKFSPEDIQKVGEILEYVANELMPEAEI